MGLFVAWLLHDIEELVTMPRWASRNGARLRGRFPRVPERVWRALDYPPAQVYLGVGLVGVVMPSSFRSRCGPGGHSTGTGPAAT